MVGSAVETIVWSSAANSIVSMSADRISHNRREFSLIASVAAVMSLELTSSESLTGRSLQRVHRESPLDGPV
jgi:hypothetical protein